MAKTLKIVLLAGEASGDHLGADLMEALREMHSGEIEFHGVGGEAMTAQGVNSLFPMTELSIMGLAEILPRALPLLQRIAQTAAFIQGSRPDVVITIDSPGFNFRVAKKIRHLGIPAVHYVAPQAWAWRPWRARELARLYDKVLAILPFEPAFFAKYGVDARFVGHPIVARVAASNSAAQPEAFRSKYGLDPELPVALALPGSRHSEVKRLLPKFAEAYHLLHSRGVSFSLVLPTVAAVHQEVLRHSKSWAIPVQVVNSNEDRRDAFAAADVALAASGTVALELLLNNVASLIAYRTNPFSAVIARLLVRVKYASLTNILCGEEVQPEFMQENCRADLLSERLSQLMSDGPQRQKQYSARSRIIDLLSGGGTELPSQPAAKQILDLIL